MRILSPILASDNFVIFRRVCAFGLITFSAIGAADAYDPTLTHRWIARQAIEYLRKTYPGKYDVMDPYVENIVAGVFEEDDVFIDGDDDPLTLRVMRHFYRPTDLEGLISARYGEFPNSYQWAVEPNQQNTWGYDDAIAHYRAGNTELAFETIGHVVHLVEDLTVPAHTHLDEHGPPYGDDYEAYCTSQMRSQYDGDLPLPAEGTPIPEFSSLEEAWQVTSRISYYRNMVPGKLSAPHDRIAEGVLPEMFPDLKVGVTDQTWKIAGIGELGKAFWEYEPGLFYFKKIMKAGQIDRTNFSWTHPDMFEYGPNDGSVLAANMAKQLVPVAIVHSAAVLKMFMDEIAQIEVEGPGKGPDPVAPENQSSASWGCQTASSVSTLYTLLSLLFIGFFTTRMRRDLL